MSGPTDPAEEHFDKGSWGYDGTLWRKLPLLWGYSDRYFENLGTASAPSTTYYKEGTAVPAGEVWVISTIGLMNETRNGGPVLMWVRAVGIACFVYVNVAPVQLVPNLANISVVLKEGDMVGVQQYSVSVGDQIGAYVLGYKMKINL